jgi:hypothetical protein
MLNDERRTRQRQPPPRRSGIRNQRHVTRFEPFKILLISDRLEWALAAAARRANALPSSRIDASTGRPAQGRQPCNGVRLQRFPPAGRG